MALKECKECKSEVSTKTRKCPTCGVTNPTMTGKDHIAGAIFLLLLIGGAFVWIGGVETPAPPVSAKVVWEQYSPMVKERIDKNIVGKNCAALQKEFDAAFNNRRTGRSNSELMAYVDGHMRKIGCFE
jgi:hypothetical protein